MSSEAKLKNNAYEIGKKYFIRTVTYFMTGELIEIYDHEIVIDKCAWIADTGRYSDCFIKGDFDEIEPVPGKVIINRHAIIDVTEWNHDLPREQK